MKLKKLRQANIKRQEEWPGSDQIDLSFRGLELAGETGELCNLLKKLVRLENDIIGTKETEQELIAAIEDEIADVIIVLDLLALYLDIDIAKATINKFNKTSEKQNLETRL